MNLSITSRRTMPMNSSSFRVCPICTSLFVGEIMVILRTCRSTMSVGKLNSSNMQRGMAPPHGLQLSNFLSIKKVSMPACARVSAAHAPPGPPPTTATRSLRPPGTGMRSLRKALRTVRVLFVAALRLFLAEPTAKAAATAAFAISTVPQAAFAAGKTFVDWVAIGVRTTGDAAGAKPERTKAGDASISSVASVLWEPVELAV
mmetsp:Transcript_45815/g.102792  ORF Transcript_45815/g.102792 Transcript_45815/m.102792 type:complete len:203 (+) Transcript_45815:1301-1909(+)